MIVKSGDLLRAGFGGLDTGERRRWRGRAIVGRIGRESGTPKKKGGGMGKQHKNMMGMGRALLPHLPKNQGSFPNCQAGIRMTQPLPHSPASFSSSPGDFRFPIVLCFQALKRPSPLLPWHSQFLLLLQPSAQTVSSSRNPSPPSHPQTGFGAPFAGRQTSL